MTDLELAYLAGAIDSDGTIGVRRSTYAMRVRGDAGAPVFSERIALRQVTAIIPEMLKSRFGGSLYMTKPYSAKGRPLFSWAVTDLQATICLRALLPHLRIKREQAINCLALRDLKVESRAAKVPFGRAHAGAARRPEALTVQMDELYVRAKSLDAVGV